MGMGKVSLIQNHIKSHLGNVVWLLYFQLAVMENSCIVLLIVHIVLKHFIVSLPQKVNRPRAFIIKEVTV